MAKKLIFDTRDIETLSDFQLILIDKAVYATAYEIRNRARENFRKNVSLYKHHNPELNYSGLAEGIMVGKLRNSEVKVHALGMRNKEDTHKTRFFVGGTDYRRQTKMLGKSLDKPYTKGIIKKNDSLHNASDSSNGLLDAYVYNAIKK